MNNMNNVNNAIKLYQEKERADIAYIKLKRFKQRLRSLVDSIGIEEPKFTGWFVLLKKNNNTESGFECVGIFNPDSSNPEDEPYWDVCIPIKKFDSYREFIGW